MQPSLDKLQKFFKLEAERGYDNRAVVGGLDKIVQAWINEARIDGLPENAIQAVANCLTTYPTRDSNGRQDSLKTLWQAIQTKDAVEFERISNEKPAIPVQQDSAQQTVEQSTQATPAAPNQSSGERSRHTPIERPRRASRSDDAANMGLNAPLTTLSGIGPRHAETLSALGLYTLDDLLHFFPRRYDDYSQLKPIVRLWYGEEVTVIGTIESVNVRPIHGGASSIIDCVIGDGSGFLRLTWFNQPWIANRLREGDPIVVSGKVEQYLGRLVMNSPEWEPLDQEQLHTNRIVPVYPLTARITQHWLRRIMHQTVQTWASRIPDYLPDEIRTSTGLMDLSSALLQTHWPSTNDQLRRARERLAFDEIFLLQLGVLQQKRSWQQVEARRFDTPSDWLEYQIQGLPFPLTAAQNRSISEIAKDLASGHPMNRLLQGDVGSGKTVVAALGMAIILKSGAQAAIMAPTSILADQHFKTLSRLLVESAPERESVLQPGQIRLLIGATPESEKQEIREGLSDGSIKLVVGTHALIEDTVVFQDLQMVVVDEQHRFGVDQRAALRSKGANPHLLVMTATPIPRSLALTIYGDLDLSVMDEMPVGRQTIETHIVYPRERERAYTLINSQVEQGHQAFIIYPLVEKGENDEAKAAVEERDRIQKEIFPHYKIGLLHGRLKPDDKDQVMADFRDQKYQVLVSTSVVEVGVDIPNATVMLIEGANRFGLAQLHQFRGRVGRGDAQSYCLLVPEAEDSGDNQRLSAMVESNDGFVLAERDLEQRGPGEFLGVRQSGFATLQMASLTDLHMIEKARGQAEALFASDPDLVSEGHTRLANKLHRFWSGIKGDIS